jgi:hypothetical protein
MHLKLLEKEHQAKPKGNRWKEIVKIRTVIHEMEIKRIETIKGGKH